MSAPAAVPVIPRLPHGVVEHLEDELAALPRTLDEIQQRRQFLIEGGDRHGGESVPGRHSHISDPTGWRGSALADDIRLHELTRITGAVSNVLEDLDAAGPRGQAVATLLRLYYGLDGQPVRTRPEITDLTGLSNSTIYRLRTLGLSALAFRLGWAA